MATWKGFGDHMRSYRNKKEETLLSGRILTKSDKLENVDVQGTERCKYLFQFLFVVCVFPRRWYSMFTLSLLVCSLPLIVSRRTRNPHLQQ
mmetsp:Transcript_28596/g.68855  ORF Transcript_28596/g.68855 Transcript_28596/m.68855 type:complete len:91 (+) Transcript_28596:120-392(+)